MSDITVGSLWRRKPPGREVVRVERVWTYQGTETVRAHPVRGGRVLIAPVGYISDNYLPEPARDPRESKG